MVKGLARKFDSMVGEGVTDTLFNPLFGATRQAIREIRTQEEITCDISSPIETICTSVLIDLNKIAGYTFLATLGYIGYINYFS